MQKLMTTLVMASIVTLMGCNSSNDSKSKGNEEGGDVTTGTLEGVISRPANSQPVDDGLDQVNADLLTLFGDANATPVVLDNTETVFTFIAKRTSTR